MQVHYIQQNTVNLEPHIVHEIYPEILLQRNLLATDIPVYDRIAYVIQSASIVLFHIIHNSGEKNIKQTLNDVIFLCQFYLFTLF